MDELNDLLSKIKQNSQVNLLQNNNYLSSLIQNCQTQSTFASSTPFIIGSSLNTVSSTGSAPSLNHIPSLNHLPSLNHVAPFPFAFTPLTTATNNNTNNTEPMVSIKLSVLNELIRKIRVYESLFHEMFNNNNENIKKEHNNTSIPCINTLGLPKIEHIDTKTASDNSSESISDQRRNVIGNNNNLVQPTMNKQSTRSYNKKIGHNYVNGNNGNKKSETKKKEKVNYAQYFICNECGKRYQYLCNLRSHSKVHTDKAYVCEYCNKRFGRKGNYEEHKRIHTGEQPYKCNVCNKKFRQRHAWKDHKRVHDRK